MAKALTALATAGVAAWLDDLSRTQAAAANTDTGRSAISIAICPR